jgi:sarcosine oxidase, subunit beta
MAKNAEIIIIGAGVVGCSIAYHLTKNNCKDVIVLEKDTIGSGSTSKCPGGIRQQFSTEINIRLAIESVRFFEHFEDETGCPADFRQQGYLLLTSSDEELALFKSNVILQQKLGVKVQLLTSEDAKELVPPLGIIDITGASFCPSDGFADPYSTVNGFATAARRFGAKIIEETEVVGIHRTNSNNYEVFTNNGEFQAPLVVNAAGAYASIIGKMVGLDIPVHPHKRHVFVTAPTEEVSKRGPMVVDFNTGFWFRREGAGLIFGMRNPDEIEEFDTSIDWGMLLKIANVAIRRLPSLNELGIVRAQAGLHEDTQDSSAILGSVPDLDGFYLACGFSGHGFMHSPAVGKTMAELILDGKTKHDISSLSIQRFAKQVCDKEKGFI